MLVIVQRQPWIDVYAQSRDPKQSSRLTSDDHTLNATPQSMSWLN